MEDEDCTVNEEGTIDVRYRGWTEIDPSIYSFNERVVNLDLSFNQLQSIPEEIGKFNKMTTLNCENNNIRSLPESIGKLRALKVFKAGRNNLVQLPESIGKCRKLTELILNNNKIEMIPQSIGKCINLQVLELGNNNLKDLPISLAQIKESLQHIDVTHNTDLAIIPKEVQGESSVILWIIGIRYDRTMELKTIREAITETGESMKNDKERIDAINEEVGALQKKKYDLMAEREGIWLYLQIRELRRRVRLKTNNFIQRSRQLFDRGNAQVAAS